MHRARFDPGLFLENNRNKDGEDDDVAKDCERQVVHWTLAKMSEGNRANGEEEYVGKKKRLERIGIEVEAAKMPDVTFYYYLLLLLLL